MKQPLEQQQQKDVYTEVKVIQPTKLLEAPGFISWCFFMRQKS